MISVHEALSQLFALVSPLETEPIDLREGTGRVLATAAHATRAQPPFDASAMDGYALAQGDVAEGAKLTVIGEAPAGHGFQGRVGPGEAVRIFTGAPLPTGTDHVEIQENVARDGDAITLLSPQPAGANVRKAGTDFEVGEAVAAPRILGAADIALLAAMNVPKITVTRRPEVALISTGDELVMPGEDPRLDQIIASNALGLEALLRAHGALPRVLPIAKDTAESLNSAFRFARGADLVVTIGGASVGDHDLVRPVAAEHGLRPSFYKVAIRPGKPLTAGRLGTTPMLGLPGNPVSALVCGHVFLLPMVRVMLGLPARPAERMSAPLAHDVPPNGPREHYMRAVVDGSGLRVFNRQDSSLLGVFAEANALAIRPASDPARAAGETLSYLPL